MTSGSAWRPWMTKPLISCNCSPQFRVIPTSQQRQPKQQQPTQRKIWHQCWHHREIWSTPSQTTTSKGFHLGRRRSRRRMARRRRTCHHNWRTPCNWAGHQSRRSRLPPGTIHSTPSSWPHGHTTTLTGDVCDVMFCAWPPFGFVLFCFVQGHLLALFCLWLSWSTLYTVVTASIRGQNSKLYLRQ
jgi:hypothetical protein